jgi:PAS domain S-box-containing protein
MVRGLRAWLKRHAVLVSHSSPSGRLGGRVHAYVAAVLVATGALSAALLLVGELSVERPWLLAVLAALVALENVLSVRLQRRQHGETIAHEEALIVLMALLLSPASALVAFAVGALAGQLAQRAARLKAVFNCGQLVGSAALAFLVVDTVAPAGESDPQRVLAALLGVLAFTIANRAAVGGVLALTGASSFRENLREDLGPVALVWLGTVSVGLLAGLAGLAHSWALPFALAAMVVLSIAFSGHARARRERQAHTEVVRSAAAAIFSIDESGRVVSWNPEMERITGLVEEEALDTSLAELVRSYRADGSVADLLSPSLLSQPGGRETLRVDAAGGGERWLTLSRAMLPDGGMAFVAQDVTEQRATEDKYRRLVEQLPLAVYAFTLTDSGTELRALARYVSPRVEGDARLLP